MKIVLWTLFSILVLLNTAKAQPTTTALSNDPVSNYIILAKIKNVVHDFYKYQKMEVNISSVELVNSKGSLSKNLVKIAINYIDTKLNRKGQVEIIIDRWSREYQYISEYNLIVIDPKNYRGQMTNLGHGQWLKRSDDRVSALVSDLIIILNEQ